MNDDDKVLGSMAGKLDEYLLVEVGTGSGDGHAILHVPTKGLLYIEDDDVYRRTIEIMLKRGVRVITTDELKKM